MRAAMLAAAPRPRVPLGLFALSVLLGSALVTNPAWPHTITGHVTCDNQFEIYTAASELPGMVLNSANVTACHPSTAAINFTTPDRYLYIACWSDNTVAQGLLHDLVIDGQSTPSQDPRWRVTYADEDYADVCPAVPLNVPVRMAAVIPSPPGGWILPTIGCENGPDGCYGVWGQFTQISPTARRAWYDSGNQISPNAPFQPGFNHREFLIFRLDMGVPAVDCASASASVCPGDTIMQTYCVTNTEETATSLCIHASNTFSACTFDTTFTCGAHEQVCFTVKCPTSEALPPGTYSATLTASFCSDTARASSCVSPVVVQTGPFEVTGAPRQTVRYNATSTTGDFCFVNRGPCAESFAYELSGVRGWLTGGSAPLSGSLTLQPDQAFCMTADFHASGGPGIPRDTLRWIVTMRGEADTTYTILSALDSSLVEVPDLVAGWRVQLHPPVPNPVRALFRVSAELPGAGHARLRVVDVSGRVVAVLADRDLPAGRHEFLGSGSRIPAGFYYLVLDVDGARSRRPLVVVR